MRDTLFRAPTMGASRTSDLSSTRHRLIRAGAPFFHHSLSHPGIESQNAITPRIEPFEEGSMCNGRSERSNAYRWPVARPMGTWRSTREAIQDRLSLSR